MKPKKELEIIVTHKEAFRDYFILETLEAGIMLVGCEVKSLRSHEASLSGSFARIDGKKLVLFNTYIAELQSLSYVGQDSYQSGFLAGKLAQFFQPSLTENERAIADLEGWILGIA